MKILHCADIHIGYERHAKFNATLNMNGRVADYKQAFDEMVQIGLDEDIDLFLFCGDAFINATPSPTHQSIFAQCLSPIAKAGIPIVMLMGNHDTLQSADKRSSIHIFKYLAGNIHIFEEPTLSPYLIHTKSGDVQLIAIPWLNKNNLRIVAKMDWEGELNEKLRNEIIPNFISTLLDDTDPNLPVIIAGHFTMHGAIPFGLRLDAISANQELQLPVSNFDDPRIDYVALGHIHNFKDLNAGRKPPVVYSGSIERTSFKEELHKDKGFVMIDIDERKNLTYEFRKLKTREMLSIEVNLKGISAATELVLNEIATEDIVDKIVKLTLKTDHQTGVIEYFAIQKALSAASYIDPIRIEKEENKRENRSVTSAQMSIEEGILAFTQDYENWAPQKDKMIDLAREIEIHLAQKPV